MKTLSKWLDSFNSFMYSSSLSVMDATIISLIATFSSFHWAVWILLAPWIFYSTHQKAKYDK